MAKVVVGNGLVDPKQLSLARNIRQDFDDDPGFKALLANAKERLEAGEQPIVQPITWYFMGGKGFVYLGHRRARVGQLLSINIPGVKVDPPASDAERIITQLTENDDEFRKSLNPIETAHAILRILQNDSGLTQKDLAKRMKKSPPWITQHLALLSLPDTIQQMVSSGEMMVACAYDIKTKFDKEQIQEHENELINRATAGSQKKSRALIDQFATFLDETSTLFDELPTKQDPPQEQPDIPKQEPVDETIMRLRSMADMIRGLIEKFKTEAKEAGIGIESQLQDIIKIVKEEV